MRFIREQTARCVALQAQRTRRAARRRSRNTDIDALLRDAVREAIQDERDTRQRWKESDARFQLKMDQIAAVHRQSEEILKRLEDKLG
jgi:hypothetical protein